MALSLHCSSPLRHPRHHPLHLQPQSRALQFTTCPCRSHRVIRVNAATTRKNPRPSFFEQVQGKWSRKPSSTRDQLPWQQQQQKKEDDAAAAEEVEEVEMRATLSGVDESQTEIPGDASTIAAASFPLPNRPTSAPWVQGNRNRNGYLRDLGSNGLVEFWVEKAGNGAVDEAESAETKEVDSISTEREEDEAKSEDDSVPYKLAIQEVKETDDGLFVEETRRSSNSVESPWNFSSEKKEKKRESNTELAERMVPEHELKRLRNVALRMLERINVGVAGVTQDLVDAVHEKWRLDEVVKLKFEGPPSRNMKRTHEILESRTGGLVIWRSGTSVVLYRGMSYQFRCVRSYAKQKEAVTEASPSDEAVTNDDDIANKGAKGLARAPEPIVQNSVKGFKDLSKNELLDLTELNHLLDGLGPRFKDWSGIEPFPVDADRLPAVVPGYKPPFRLLPYGVKHCLRDKETTKFRRLARMTPPHFALGRNRDLQGLAKAIVKLWEQSAIAKIAIKRGVENTRNDRMTEELKRLTGGTLLSRNKDFIVFYRGNDFLPPAVMETLKERQKLSYLQNVEEELVRQMAPLNIITTKVPAVAGTLAETVAATSRWGKQPSNEDVKEMMRDSAVARISSLLKHLQNKFATANGKLKKAEKALYKVQERLEPKELPTDLETITNEERFLFRRIGLSMKPYLPLGRREVYDGTIENMHLHWKYHELVKIIVAGKNPAQVKHIAINLEAESGGVLVAVERIPEGYAIIVYRGKNYKRPQVMRPKNLLSRRQALARSIELQRREALKHHVLDLQERIELIKSELQDVEAGKTLHTEKTLTTMLDNASLFSDDDEQDGGEESCMDSD
ncbi:unnamed protein product [Linum tenue]|uniref:CRM domain-containing protein n=1 Tax=Linum tenue TaxID=586396 RepID=A0AAV0S489_9ROSI|nr:unnamed protein product [Linum tenue]